MLAYFKRHNCIIELKKVIESLKSQVRPRRNIYKENPSDRNFSDYYNHFNKYRNSNPPDTDL